MRSSTDRVCCADPTPNHLEDHDLKVLQTRVSAEFREMPGLMLTLPQAARLFSIEPPRCERVLGTLVERGFLASYGRKFARTDIGAR